MLAASGLIAGEALIGLFIAAVVGIAPSTRSGGVGLRRSIAPWLAIPVFAFLAWYLIASRCEGGRGRRAGAADGGDVGRGEFSRTSSIRR